MFKKMIVVLFTALFLVISFSAVNAANLTSVSYSISGDSFDVDTLELEPEFMINNVHPAKLNLAFDGDDFYIGANMGLNMIMQDNFRLDLNLMLTNKIDGHNFGKAFGLRASTRGNDLNFFWKTYYFVDDDLDDHAYYKGGAYYSIGPRSSLEISFANQYWDLDNDVIKLGMKFKL